MKYTLVTTSVREAAPRLGCLKSAEACGNEWRIGFKVLETRGELQPRDQSLEF